MAEYLAQGVAVHSAALNYDDRKIVEDLFVAQDVLVLWYRYGMTVTLHQHI
jgi:replicative superfamily II helicase